MEKPYHRSILRSRIYLELAHSQLFANKRRGISENSVLQRDLDGSLGEASSAQPF
jgi:hypothetical protein